MARRSANAVNLEKVTGVAGFTDLAKIVTNDLVTSLLGQDMVVTQINSALTASDAVYQQGVADEHPEIVVFQFPVRDIDVTWGAEERVSEALKIVAAKNHIEQVARLYESADLEVQEELISYAESYASGRATEAANMVLTVEPNGRTSLVHELDDLFPKEDAA